MKAHLGPIACVWVVMAALAGGAGPAAGSAVIFVDADAGGASNGTSWADAYTSVQPALSAAQPGDQVWVAAGVYVENITLALGVALYGGFAGIEDPVTFNLADRDFVVNETTLDGNHAGSVVTGPPGATETTRIDGFTITNGSGTNVVGTTTEGGGVYLDESSPAIENNVIRGNSVTGDGGGLRLGSSAPLIAHNTIRANNGRYGGGLYLGGSSPTIIENQIYDNLATRSGGGLHLSSSSPLIAHNTIRDNVARGGYFVPELSGSVGPDEFGEGGGLLLLNGSAPTIAHNAIVGNSAVRTGGGLAIVYCSPTIVNNTIADNVATGARASGHVPGGGGLTAAGDPIIANNVITGNVAGVECWGRGGGICLPSGSATVATNVIAANSAWGGGGAYLAGSPTFTNTIIAFNTSGIANVGTAVPTLRNNCVFGNVAYDYDGLADPTGTDGNISADPLFVLPPAPGADGTWGTADDVPGNLHLWPDSPCIDAGDNAFAVGAFDLDGLPRIVDGDGDGTATVDMGAYELQVLPPVCAGDSNGDGVINWRDVDFFVAAINDNRTAWAALHGPGAPPCPFANNDANADGTVNWRDIDPLVAVMNTVCP